MLGKPVSSPPSKEGSHSVGVKKCWGSTKYNRCNTASIHISNLWRVKSYSNKVLLKGTPFAFRRIAGWWLNHPSEKY